MKTALLIYNPRSGTASFKDNLDSIIDNIQTDYENNLRQYNVKLFRIFKYGDIYEYLENNKDFDIIIGSGGDGTINMIVSAMIKYDIDKPLCIIPSGTANDLASYLKLPKNPIDIVKLIHKNNLAPLDIGSINDRYFINVVAIGVLANISMEVDQELKHVIGKLAYYIKGLEKLTHLSSLKVKITTNNDEYEEDLLFMLILNSTGAGGFRNLSKNSSVNDGIFEFIGFKKTTPLENLKTFFKNLGTTNILQNNILKNNIVVLKDSDFKIELLDTDTKTDVHCDIDGELGPKLPVTVKVLPSKINVFVQ
ncbi:MAG: diacylglycerol/lipid kinase family protein [Lachnospirales bacterium]